jgi:hypothetical protein
VTVTVHDATFFTEASTTQVPADVLPVGDQDLAVLAERVIVPSKAT